MTDKVNQGTCFAEMGVKLCRRLWRRDVCETRAEDEGDPQGAFFWRVTPASSFDTDETLKV